jgi:hypothetical protein
MHSVVNEAAVSHESGFVLFDVDPGQTGRPHITEVGGSPVPSVKLDDYIIAAQPERIDFVKLDIVRLQTISAARSRACAEK